MVRRCFLRVITCVWQRCHHRCQFSSNPHPKRNMIISHTHDSNVNGFISIIQPSPDPLIAIIFPILFATTLTNQPKHIQPTLKEVGWSTGWGGFPILCVREELCPLIFIASTRTHERAFDACSLGSKFNPKDEITFHLRECVFIRVESVHPRTVNNQLTSLGVIIKTENRILPLQAFHDIKLLCPCNTLRARFTRTLAEDAV
mmetsp:Transcript_27011/g.53943  ORF Transcript_27011/g.53943 Transcript_27011/m.53943 type:complete len:202 (+) Transcript_27011:1696-2301(+)